MATYVILSSCVMLIAILTLFIKRPLSLRRAIVLFIALFLLTAVFDSLLVYFNIIDYTASKILGIRIGKAPIEDFFYPLFALIVIPFLWESLGKK